MSPLAESYHCIRRPGTDRSFDAHRLEGRMGELACLLEVAESCQREASACAKFCSKRPWSVHRHPSRPAKRFLKRALSNKCAHADGCSNADRGVIVCARGPFLCL